MAPKPVPFMDDETGVACTNYKGDKVKVGIGSEGRELLRDDRFMVPVRVEETPAEAVSRHRGRIKAILSRYASNGTQHPLLHALR